MRVRVSPSAPKDIMKKRVFIVHGWYGHPNKNWFPWLKEELEAKNFEVCVPELPEPGKPRINSWVKALAEAVGKPDETTYFVGHSMGCQTIARYLEALGKNIKVGGAVFVAGFFKQLTNMEPEEQPYVKHWLETPLDLDLAKNHLNKSIALFSDDDPWVPLDNQVEYRDILGSEIIIKHKLGHFSFKQAPDILNAVLKLAGES